MTTPQAFTASEFYRAGRSSLPLIQLHRYEPGIFNSYPAAVNVGSWIAAGDHDGPILTYNIHHGEGTDGRLDLKRIANVIAAAQPDLVALQEVDRGTVRASGVDELAELAHQTTMRAAFGKAMDYMSGSYGVAVLSRWPLTSARNYRLPSLPNHEPRTALTVELRAGDRGPRLEFTCTHLDQAHGPASRLVQAQYLNDLLVRDDIRPAVLAGDMIATPDTAVMNLFEARWVNPSAADPLPPQPGGGRSRIDYVLVRPAHGWRVTESTLIDEPVASDHRPLLVVLDWTGWTGFVAASELKARRSDDHRPATRPARPMRPVPLLGARSMNGRSR